jgi:hypothetical protein
MGTARSLFHRGGQEIASVQTAERLEQLAPISGEWLGGQGSRRAAAIGLAEQDMTDAVQKQAIRGSQQATLGIDRTEDEVGMIGVRGKETPGRVDGGVNGLDGNLGRGKVPADQDVEMSNLRERSGHGSFLLLALYGVASESEGPRPGFRPGENCSTITRPVLRTERDEMSNSEWRSGSCR